MAKKTEKPDAAGGVTVTEILQINQGRIEFCILGRSPLICNRFSEKAMRELLLPAGRKNAAARAMTLKHDPLTEFRASPHRMRTPSAPTELAIHAAAFKKSLCTAALDMPGTKRTQIGRLTWVVSAEAVIDSQKTPVFGVPKLMMSMVRSADINKTPDVRTRAILPEWACRLTIAYADPLIKPQAIINLLAAAGLYVGVGDWRPEKISGTHGQFAIVAPDDPEFVRIVAEGGKAAQIAALENPDTYDEDSRELLDWYQAEVSRRNMRGVS